MAKTAVEGLRVMPGDTLYDIVDLSTVWVLADIYEVNLPFVRLGQQAEMLLPYQPGKKYSGRVTFINPTLDEKTRTVKARIEFANPQGDPQAGDVWRCSDPWQSRVWSGRARKRRDLDRRAKHRLRGEGERGVRAEGSDRRSEGAQSLRNQERRLGRRTGRDRREFPARLRVEAESDAGRREPQADTSTGSTRQSCESRFAKD